MDVHKKRGRKPKGGKIMEADAQSVVACDVVQNIILHLKCSSADLKQPFANECVIEPFCTEVAYSSEVADVSANELNLHQKLKRLADSLHHNDINGRSDCFWCTHPFETPTIYIPKCRVKNNYVVYGSFCSPQCAAAHLLSEPHMDSSVRFERYHMLNFIYGKPYGYTKNILPAPSPYYLLDKFYGKLSIAEYRQMLENDQFIFVVDKPISCTYPELIQNQDCSLKQDDSYRLCRKKKNYFIK
jgi:hypothetical protein